MWLRNCWKNIKIYITGYLEYTGKGIYVEDYNRICIDDVNNIYINFYCNSYSIFMDFYKKFYNIKPIIVDLFKRLEDFEQFMVYHKTGFIIFDHTSITKREYDTIEYFLNINIFDVGTYLDTNDKGSIEDTSKSTYNISLRNYLNNSNGMNEDLLWIILETHIENYRHYNHGMKSVVEDYIGLYKRKLIINKAVDKHVR